MRTWTWVATVVVSALAGAAGSTLVEQVGAAAKTPSLTALDYQEINQLINRYAYGIDTCANNGYDYADVFTPDGVFIDKNSDQGFAQGGRVLAKGREALATGRAGPKPHSAGREASWPSPRARAARGRRQTIRSGRRPKALAVPSDHRHSSPRTVG